MKKSEFRQIVKEIISEVINEIDEVGKYRGNQHSQYPRPDITDSADPLKLRAKRVANFDEPPVVETHDEHEPEPDDEPVADTEPLPTPTPKGLKKHGRMSRVLDKWRAEQQKKDPQNKWSWPNAGLEEKKKV